MPAHTPANARENTPTATQFFFKMYCGKRCPVRTSCVRTSAVVRKKNFLRSSFFRTTAVVCVSSSFRGRGVLSERPTPPLLDPRHRFPTAEATAETNTHAQAVKKQHNVIHTSRNKSFRHVPAWKSGVEHTDALHRQRVRRFCLRGRGRGCWWLASPKPPASPVPVPLRRRRAGAGG